MHKLFIIVFSFLLIFSYLDSIHAYTACEVDLNSDTIVDISDYTLFVGRFFDKGENLEGDYNRDGIIDISDYQVLIANFLNTCESLPTSQPNPSGETVTFDVIKDTYVNAGYPSSNYGSKADIISSDYGSNDITSYLAFDLSQYAGRTVTSAELLIVPNLDRSVSKKVISASSSWDELTMTYSSKAPTYDQIGVFDSFGNSLVIGSPISITLDSAAVQTSLGQLFSVALLNDGSGNTLQYYSKESSGIGSQLIIAFDGGGATPVPTSGASPSPSSSPTPTPIASGGAYRAFKDESFWNTPIPYDAPIDPNSDDYIASAMNSTSSDNPFLKISGAPNQGRQHSEDWGYPIYWASENDPYYTIKPTSYGDTISMRIPLGAKPQSGSDGGIIIYDFSSDLVTELWRAVYDRSSNQWRAESTKHYTLSSLGISKRISTGNDSTTNNGHRGLPPSIRAIRVDEVASGTINRKLECFWHGTAPYSYSPMDGFESEKGGITPEGIMLRIKPSIDLDNKGLSKAERVIAQALKDYGCIIGDNDGGNGNSLKMESDYDGWVALDPDMHSEGLEIIPFTDYEFILGGYGAPPLDDGKLVNN